MGDASGQPRPQDPLWLPPTTERRSSLAISALLGSPQHAPRSRPSTADVSQQPPQPSYGQPGYPYPGQEGAPPGPPQTVSSLPATPVVNGTSRKDRHEAKSEGHGNIDEKAKTLVGAGGR
jgi:hypothetical protein